MSIAEYLAAAMAPAPVRKLLKDLRVTADAVDEAVRSGQAFVWPKQRGAVRYWRVDPEALVRKEALDAVAARALTKPELVKAVGTRSYGAGSKTIQAAVAALVREGALGVAKPVGATALLYDPRRPQALVDRSIDMVRERLRKLGIDAAASEPAHTPAPETPLAERILEAVGRLQPAPLVPVTAQALRAALAGVSQTEFDACVITLADQRKLYLTTHDHGWALPEAERETLVWDGGAKLYVAVTLRD